MWMTADGVAHTAALPDPTWGMDNSFVGSLEALSDDDRDALVDAVTELEDQLFELPAMREGSQALAPEAEQLPQGHLTGNFGSVDEIASYLGSLHLAWRLDALLAVKDFLDELSD